MRADWLSFLREFVLYFGDLLAFYCFACGRWATYCSVLFIWANSLLSWCNRTYLRVNPVYHSELVSRCCTSEIVCYSALSLLFCSY